MNSSGYIDVAAETVFAKQEAMEQAVESFRSNLVRAIRTKGTDWGPWDEATTAEVIALIQSFNPVPDDVGTRLASPVHDEEPNL